MEVTQVTAIICDVCGYEDNPDKWPGVEVIACEQDRQGVNKVHLCGPICLARWADIWRKGKAPANEIRSDAHGNPKADD